MNNKFENENEEDEKLFKKSLLDRTLHKNTGPNQKPCIRIHMNY